MVFFHHPSNYHYSMCCQTKNLQVKNTKSFYIKLSYNSYMRITLHHHIEL